MQILIVLLVMLMLQSCTTSRVDVGQVQIIYEPVMTANKE
jgi:hypothetical protein